MALKTQERLPKKIPKKGAHPIKVNEEEAPICKKLHEKYGDDYEYLCHGRLRKQQFFFGGGWWFPHFVRWDLTWDLREHNR